MEKAGMVIRFRQPPGKAFFPNGGKLGKKLGHPQHRFKIPQPNGPVTAYRNWIWWVFHRSPSPYYGRFISSKDPLIP